MRPFQSADGGQARSVADADGVGAPGRCETQPKKTNSNKKTRGDYQESNNPCEKMLSLTLNINLATKIDYTILQNLNIQNFAFRKRLNPPAKVPENTSVRFPQWSVLTVRRRPAGSVGGGPCPLPSGRPKYPRDDTPLLCPRRLPGHLNYSVKTWE